MTGKLRHKNTIRLSRFQTDESSTRKLRNQRKDVCRIHRNHRQRKSNGYPKTLRKQSKLQSNRQNIHQKKDGLNVFFLWK